MKLIVGLGNPGRQYAATRHNVGFMVLDELARRHRIPVAKRIGRSVTGQGQIGDEDVILVKPLTYMNLSGEAVSHLLRRMKIKPEDIIVVYDDVDLPLGKLRLRPKGSAGTHNGMKSIIGHVGSNAFPRLRVGIGSIRGEAVDFVLSKFKRSEQPVMKAAIEDAASALEMVLTDGLEPAMNRFNQRAE